MKTYEQILEEYILVNYKDSFLPSYALSYRYPKDFRYKVKLSKKHWFWAYATSKKHSEEIIKEKYFYSQIKNDPSILFKDIGEPVEKICRRFLEKPDIFIFTKVGDKVIYDFLDKGTGIIFTLKGRVAETVHSNGRCEFRYVYNFYCSNNFEGNELENRILLLCLKELYQEYFMKIEYEENVKRFKKEEEDRLTKLKTARESMVNIYKNL